MAEGWRGAGVARWSSCEFSVQFSGDELRRGVHELEARRGAVFNGNGTRRTWGFL